MSESREDKGITGRFPRWSLALLPLLLLAGLVVLFLQVDPLRLFTGNFPPVEELTIQQVHFPAPGEMELEIINGGPEPVTVAQVRVDEAYWYFEMSPDRQLQRLEQATIFVPYPWVYGEPLPISLVTSTGVTFDTEVEVAVETPGISWTTFLAYGLLGIYVGVIPVALGMLWFPFMRRIDRRWMNGVLALTIGLLIFLFFDTILEALDLAGGVAGALQGVPLVFLVTLLSLGVLLAAGTRGDENSPRRIATLIALGIGLHNLGEGLAIGAAFAGGLAALGSFLVVGFTLHNVTEGVGIAAPLLRGERPALRFFLLLALLAGLPAMLGAWLGGFAYSPFWATIFLAAGSGAILQVIWEVGRLLAREAREVEQPLFSWINVGGLALGIFIMYATALLVAG